MGRSRPRKFQDFRFAVTHARSMLFLVGLQRVVEMFGNFSEALVKQGNCGNTQKPTAINGAIRELALTMREISHNAYKQDYEKSFLFPEKDTKKEKNTKNCSK